MEHRGKRKTVATNKKAYHDYFVLETLECGIALQGNEVKSVRDGKVSIKESWVDIVNNQLVLKQCHITNFDKSFAFDIKDEKRDRKLLAHKAEILKLAKKVEQAGYTLVPTKVYVKDQLIKVEVALCKGKHSYDKRESLKKKQAERDIARYTNR